MPRALVGLIMLGNLIGCADSRDEAASPEVTAIQTNDAPTGTEASDASAVAVPDVVGKTGNTAENALSDAGFGNVTLVDGMENRSVLMRSNWVVIEQSPAAGQVVSADTAIELRLRKSTDPAPQEPLAGAPTDGTWAGGQVPYGSSHDFASYRFAVAGPPTVTTEVDEPGVQVQTAFTVTRFAEVGEYNPPIGDMYTFLFLSGNDPAKTVTSDYGAADFECDDWRLEQGESTTCRLTFNARTLEEVTNSFWSIESVTFGAWPSQASEVSAATSGSRSVGSVDRPRRTGTRP